jgi:hypothetical protein
MSRPVDPYLQAKGNHLMRLCNKRIFSESFVFSAKLLQYLQLLILGLLRLNRNIDLSETHCKAVNFIEFVQWCPKIDISEHGNSSTKE